MRFSKIIIILIIVCFVLSLIGMAFPFIKGAYMAPPIVRMSSVQSNYSKCLFFMSKIVIAQDDIFTDSCVKRIEEEYYASIHSNEYFDLLEDVEFDAANFIQSDNNIYIAIGEFIRYAKEYNYEACARIVASDELNNDYLDFAKNMQTAISLRELRAAEWAAKIDSYKLNVDFFIAFVLLIVLTLHIVSKRTKKTKK